MKCEINWSIVEAGSLIITVNNFKEAIEKAESIRINDVIGSGEIEFNIDEINEK